MIVEENGKKYDVDENTGLVRVASASTDEPQELDFERDFRVGNRVEVDGETGTVISITASVYGGAYGIRFDDGSIDEYGEGQLKHTEIEKEATYDTPVDEVLVRFEAYEALPHYTNAEIAAKEEEARFLNLRAAALVSDSKLQLHDQNKLGKVVLVTGNDLIDLKELREQSAESQEYLGRFNRYKIADEVSGYGAGLGLKGDASWLADALEGMEVVETTDADLAVRAAELVSAFTKAQLEDDEFMTVASSYHKGYLQMTDADAVKFDSYLAQARSERIKEIPVEQVKEASTGDDLDDFDTAALYL